MASCFSIGPIPHSFIIRSYKVRQCIKMSIFSASKTINILANR